MLSRVGPYLLERKLGSGGMGTVYLGVHDTTGERAAVKVLPAALAREEGFRERFAREVETVRRLHDPHIAGHLASGAVGPDGQLLPEAPPGGAGVPDDAVAFLALEYVPGETLLVRLRRDRRLGWRAAADLGVQVCAALTCAHAAGVVHRDLKPSNLILTPLDGDGADPNGVGHVTLVDFGVAQLFAAGRLTKTGGVIGTAEFMAPEQAAGGRVDRTCDLYSLGAVLYACVCGVPPFRGKSAVEVLQQHRFGTFDAPRRYAPDLPRAFEAVVCELLSKTPADRPADARTVAGRLRVTLNRANSLIGESTGVTPGDRHPEGRSLTLSDRPTRAAGDTEDADPAGVVLGEGDADPLGERPTVGTAVRSPAISEPLRDAAAEPDVEPETAEEGPIARFLRQTWGLWGALGLLFAGGLWWFQPDAVPPPGEMTVGQHLAAARAALEQPPGAAWTRARDRHLGPLLAPGGIAAIEARTAADDDDNAPLTPAARSAVRAEAGRLLDRVRRYELETAARRRGSDPPATEADRFLRLAAHQTAVGDRPAAAHTLRGFLAATAPAGGDDDSLPSDLAQSRRIAAAMLADLAAAEAPPPPLAAAALREMREALAAGDRARAGEIARGLRVLYADDPAAAGPLREADALLGSDRPADPAAMEPAAGGG